MSIIFPPRLFEVQFLHLNDSSLVFKAANCDLEPQTQAAHYPVAQI